MTPLESLVEAGTKLWLDSIDPDEIAKNRDWGATGATSNPIIVSDLIATGRFDGLLKPLFANEPDDSVVAWATTSHLVAEAQKVFLPVWEKTKCDDGWVSFELDPLLEDPQDPIPEDEKARRYIELGRQWAKDHKNRMIKVPATPGGLAALEELVASGVNVNVTLIFSQRQYIAARDACWRGAQRFGKDKPFKTVYSIFVSRVDVYTEKHCPSLTPEAQGQVGIVNAKKIWRMNQEFWADKGTAVKQELIFASTGTKKKTDDAWKYVEAFAGSDIETNPPKTNADVQASGKTFTRHVDEMPSAEVIAEIEHKVSEEHLEETLMREGLQKFADPQKELLKMIAKKRAEAK